MARPRNNIVDYIIYLLGRVVAAFLMAADVPTLYAIARAVGRILYAVDRRHRELALEQVQRSFPEWSEAKVRAVALQSLQSIVMLGVETLLIPRLVTPAQWRKRFILKGFAPLLQLLVENRSGVIMLTGHYGNWEVGGYALAALGFPAVAIFRPLDNRYFDRFIRGVRERRGLKLVDKTGASAIGDQVLQDHGTLCFIADQDAGRKGIYVDFFGRPASTYRAIALLAIRHNVPIAVSYARRLNDQFFFEGGVTRIIRPEDWAGRDDEVRWITQTFTSELESIIRANPGQYFGWAHRRWKHQPKTKTSEG
jgi:Kdo2-lipid IVA lauroyltransferase/acyltransferase